MLISMFVSSFSFTSPSLAFFESMNKTLKKKNSSGGKMNKSNTAYFVAFFNAGKRGRESERREGERLKSLKWGPLIIGPGRCLSRQPFLGTLLEMSTAGNWIRLAVRVEPQLTDAQTGETLKWQMFPLLLKPECKAVTSRYRLSDEVWGLWQSSGLLKSTSLQWRGDGGVRVGRGDWCFKKALSKKKKLGKEGSFFPPCLGVFGKSSKMFIHFLIKGHLHLGPRAEHLLFSLTMLQWCGL